MAVTPFSVSVPEATLVDLRERLARTRFPDTVSDAGWAYGTDVAYLRELVAYWRDDFDWRAQERRLNSFPQFTAEVEGTRLHFVHQRGTGPAPIPVLLLHGWPSSFVQMLDLAPLLADPVAHGSDPADSFDVVAASLVGYGFSGRPTEPGMSVDRMATLFHTLMTEELGYTRYAIRGGDLGAGILGRMAARYPGSVIGVHTGGTTPFISQVPDDLSPAEQEFVTAAQRWSMEEMAYAMEQSSRPQTLAAGLNDSPAGLAAWVIEKFRRWSDCDGDLERRFSKDELLTNLTVYWVTETIGSSMRLYYETVRDPHWDTGDVPTAMLMSSKDMFPTPREWAARSGRIDRWVETDRGGHFLEWEEPELVAGDMRAFFRDLR
jgi:pimeloyl-ACP methyl ester carboxylesterase